MVFKLVLRYDYSTVLYNVSGMHNAVVLCICAYVSVLPLLCLNVIQEVIIHTGSVYYSKAQLVQYNTEKV